MCGAPYFPDFPAAAGTSSSSSPPPLAKAAWGVRTRCLAAGRAHGAQNGPTAPPAELGAITLCGLGGDGGGAAAHRPSCAHSRQSLAALTWLGLGLELGLGLGLGVGLGWLGLGFD